MLFSNNGPLHQEHVKLGKTVVSRNHLKSPKHQLNQQFINIAASWFITNNSRWKCFQLCNIDSSIIEFKPFNAHLFFYVSLKGRTILCQVWPAWPSLKRIEKEYVKKTIADVPFPRSVTVSFSEVATSSVHCNTRDFSCYPCASGEIIWQLVRDNGYFRTFPPIANLHTAYSVKLWTFKISLLLIAAHFLQCTEHPTASQSFLFWVMEISC